MPDDLIRKVAVLKKEAGRASKFVRVREPKAGEPVNRQAFVDTFDRTAWRQAGARDGCYSQAS